MAAVNYHQPSVPSTFYLHHPTKPAGPSPPADTTSLYYGKPPTAAAVCASPTSSSHTPPPSSSSATGLSPTNNTLLLSHHPQTQSHVNVRQLRQPRQPLYIPAALRPTDTRPTDIPGRIRAPDTPPASKDNSFDSAKSAADLSAAGSGGSSALPGAGPPRSSGSDLDQLRRSLSRAASESLLDEPDDDDPSSSSSSSPSGGGVGITPPTTAHWKPDLAAPHCAVCRQSFTWYFRRHHCRRCGEIVCDAHSARRVPLDQHARLHARGVASRACEACWVEWEGVRQVGRAGSVGGSAGGSSRASSQGTAVPPGLAIPGQGSSGRRGEEARVGSLARSEGMVWSTF
ncbi:Zn finger protein [Teratosphaeriaceae sp. CCFEE 6253]|nr:Zn finger protein [Teratosphaeriaceae sp. CCFEE 6253]